MKNIVTSQDTVHLFFPNLNDFSINTLSNIHFTLRDYEEKWTTTPVFHYDSSTLGDLYYSHITILTNKSADAFDLYESVKRTAKSLSPDRPKIMMVIIGDVHGDVCLQDFDQTLSNYLLNINENLKVYFPS